ncbi:MAG TPA: ester cyclase [Anaerolineae bacterium]|nr:ester cyclase [Anaerolineae bacterium]
MSLLHQNRRLWQRHVLAENRRSIEGLLDTLCSDPIYKIMATNATFKGRDQVAQFYTGLFEGVPDANFELINVFVGDAGVVEESILRGTQRGPLFGTPPTGREIALPLTIVFPILKGQIMGERLYFDLATLARELGVPLQQIDLGPRA